MDPYGGVFTPHLLVTALERNLDRPSIPLSPLGKPDKALRAGYWRGAERQVS